MPLFGFDQLARDLGKFLDFGAQPAVERTLEEIGQAVEDNAKNRLGVYQAGWPPLADVTVLERARLGYPPDEPLLREGALRDAITHGVEQGPDGPAVTVGVLEGDPSADAAAAAEMGTLTEPQRAILRPAMDDEGLRVAEHMGVAVRGVLEG